MLEENGFIHLNVQEKNISRPHAEGNFPMPSGKREFRSSLDTTSGFVAPVLRQMLAGQSKLIGPSIQCRTTFWMINAKIKMRAQIKPSLFT